MKKIIHRFVLVLLILSLGFSLRAAPLAIDFQAKTLTGSNFIFSEVLGKKNIVINFWASWCDSCEEEIEILNDLKSKYPDQENTVFLAINAGDTERAAQHFVDKTKFSYSVVMDSDKAIAKKFGILGLPQTIVISALGEIVYQNSKPPKDLNMLKVSGAQ